MPLSPWFEVHDDRNGTIRCRQQRIGQSALRRSFQADQRHHDRIDPVGRIFPLSGDVWRNGDHLGLYNGGGGGVVGGVVWSAISTSLRSELPSCRTPRAAPVRRYGPDQDPIRLP
jgi:hypothetical protein